MTKQDNHLPKLSNNIKFHSKMQRRRTLLLVPTGMHIFINSTESNNLFSLRDRRRHKISATLLQVGMVRMFVGTGVSEKHTLREQVVMIRNLMGAGLRRVPRRTV